MLKRMNRGYTREWYLERVEAIRRYIPECAITTDIIAGFSDESEQEHQQTISLMREVGYEFAFMFKYSEREGTYAAKNLPDNIDDKVKTARLTGNHQAPKRTICREQQTRCRSYVSRCWSRVSRSVVAEQMFGRTSQNKVVVFDRHDAKLATMLMLRSKLLFGNALGVIKNSPK